MNRRPRTTSFSPCNLCGSTSADYLYPKLRIIKCCDCGLVRSEEMPNCKELQELYSEDYFKSTDSGSFGYDDYMADQGKISRTFQKRLHEIEKWTGRKGRLLDVGCATGFSLEVARERGWEALGIEISEFACSFARRRLGLDILCGSLENADLDPNSFDVITMWDYIEHNPNPANEMALANRLLKKGGLLALATPDIASFPARIWRQRWMGIKQGEHLYYFTPATIKLILGRFGFEIVRLKHIGKYVDVGFFIKRTGLYSMTAERLLARTARMLGIADRVIYVNPFDIMLVYAEKIDGIG